MERSEAKQEELALLVEDLFFNYTNNNSSQSTALAGVSFACKANQIYGLLGPNGSGKSTTFKCISTQLIPHRGDVKVFGRSTKDDAQGVRSLLGVCFQKPSLDPILTVEENLLTQASLMGLPRKQALKSMHHWLELLFLSSRRHDRVDTLSGGLARRVELVKSLLHKPKLLLLDEPTTGLDPVSREDFWTHLRLLCKSGVTVVVTTHLMDEAERCDNLIFMVKGRCISGGSPDELKRNFAHEYVSFKTKDAELMMIELKHDLAGKAHIDQVHGGVRIETNNPDQVIDLLRSKYRQKLESLEWDRATLADIYRSHTGVSFS